MSFFGDVGLSLLCVGATCLEATEKKKKSREFFEGCFDPPRQEFLASPLWMREVPLKDRLKSEELKKRLDIEDAAD